MKCFNFNGKRLEILYLLYVGLYLLEKLIIAQPLIFINSKEKFNSLAERVRIFFAFFCCICEIVYLPQSTQVCLKHFLVYFFLFSIVYISCILQQGHREEGYSH